MGRGKGPFSPGPGFVPRRKKKRGDKKKQPPRGGGGKRGPGGAMPKRGGPRG